MLNMIQFSIKNIMNKERSLFMSHKDYITIRGLTQNNLKNVSLEIPKEKIVVFTGVPMREKSKRNAEYISLIVPTVERALPPKRA